MDETPSTEITETVTPAPAEAGQMLETIIAATERPTDQPLEEEKAPEAQIAPARVGLQFWKDEKALLGDRLLLILNNVQEPEAPQCYLTGSGQQGPFRFVAIIAPGSAFTALPGLTFMSGSDGIIAYQEDGSATLTPEGGDPVIINDSPLMGKSTAEAVWTALGLGKAGS